VGVIACFEWGPKAHQKCLKNLLKLKWRHSFSILRIIIQDQEDLDQVRRKAAKLKTGKMVDDDATNGKMGLAAYEYLNVKNPNQTKKEPPTFHFRTVANHLALALGSLALDEKQKESHQR
jgi:hypothetical protein